MRIAFLALLVVAAPALAQTPPPQEGAITCSSPVAPNDSGQSLRQRYGKDAVVQDDAYRFRLRSLSHGGQVAPPILRSETTKRRSIGSAFCNSALLAIPGLDPATLPARPNCENRGFAGTTVAGHFAQTGPVLGGRLRAGPVPVHLVAPPGPLLDDFAGAGSLRVHFARTGPVGASSRAGLRRGHPAPPVRAQLARAGGLVCPRLFLGRPGLELLEQFFSDRLVVGSDWLAVLGLALTALGLALTGGLGLALIGRFNSRSNFVARRRVRRCRRQILRAGDCLNCRRRRIGVRLKRRFVDPPIRHVRNERNRISDR